MNPSDKPACPQPARDTTFDGVTPERVWLRIGNCEKPGRFRVVLEVNGIDKVVYDSIDECDSNISQHTNLTWLVKREPPQEPAFVGVDHAVPGADKTVEWAFVPKEEYDRAVARAAETYAYYESELKKLQAEVAELKKKQEQSNRGRILVDNKLERCVDERDELKSRLEKSEQNSKAWELMAEARKNGRGKWRADVVRLNKKYDRFEKAIKRLNMEHRAQIMGAQCTCYACATLEGGK